MRKIATTLVVSLVLLVATEAKRETTADAASCKSEANLTAALVEKLTEYDTRVNVLWDRIFSDETLRSGLSQEQTEFLDRMRGLPPPVWHMLKTRDAYTGECIILDDESRGRVMDWYEKTHTIDAYLKSVGDIDAQDLADVDEARHIGRQIATMLLPTRRISDYRLSTHERQALAGRSAFPLFDPQVLDRISRLEAFRSMSPSLKRSTRSILNISNYRFLDKSTPYNFPKSRAIWPNYSSEVLIRSILHSKTVASCSDSTGYSSNEEEDPAPVIDRTDTRFVYREVSRVHSVRSWPLYNATFGMSGFEQLRYICAIDSDMKTMLYVFQKPKAIPLKDIYALSHLTNKSIISLPWQRALSIRMRQILEFLTSLGWIHTDVSGSRIGFDEAGFPVLLGLHMALPSELIVARFPRPADLGSKDMSYEEYFQLKTLTSADKSAWAISFNEGIEDLAAHIIEQKVEETKAHLQDK